MNGGRDYEEMTTEDLFRLYKESPNDELKWTIVMRYSDMVKHIALQIRGVYSSFAQIEDIVNEGLIVLAHSVEKYDPEKGKFETYVAKRIRGMVIDLARRQDWVPRPIRKRAKEMERANAELYSDLGRLPTDHEVAQKLNLTDDEYYDSLSRASIYSVVSLEEAMEGYEQFPSSETDEPDNMPETTIERQELIDILADSIGKLRKNEQLVLSLYYQKDMKMKDIAAILGVSFARVSQIHARAIQKLKVMLDSQ